MQCTQCQHENNPTAKFCAECGTRLIRTCPSCDHEVSQQAKFCEECGTSLTAPQSASHEDISTPAEAPSSEPSLPDAERRQLTVMFCDLADSTKLSGQLDPEDLRDVIRAYQSTSAEVIERYDGYIAQHLGDGLMVYFGWPQAHEDDAQRAVHAGLGILEAMQGLNVRLKQEKGIRLAVRIGIHTGLVVVGEIGQGASQEHLALGETPNVASRIEGIAEPGTVAISGATFELVQGYFVCETLRQYALRGVHEPQPIYRVEGVSGAQNRFEVGLTRELTPLVGRELEIGLLFERWQQVKDGMGQVVLLSGDAGIGKSRLLQVMRDHVANEPHTRLECRSSPYYQNTALYPITDLLQRALRWQQDDTPDQRLAKLEQALSHYRLSLEASVPLFAALLSLPIPEDRYPPINLSPQRQRQKTLESIVAILLEQAERQPVLFVLEDLHWLDPTSLELLDRLLEQTPTTSVLTLLTCRPTFEPTWSSRSYLTQMTLNRLSGNQIERMAAWIAGEKRLPDEVFQQIVEKTDGVPLYIEEMTKAVLESSALQEVNGQYELMESLSTLTIPASLQDSLMARLDRLVTAKGIAQYAAVIGRQFSYALLHAASQVEEATLQRELTRLVDAELVYQRGLPPQANYTFKHALIQDAAYQSLLKRTREQYHQQIAQAFADHFPEVATTQPELLAHHYTEAGQHEQAIHYWHEAGQRSIERSAYPEAIGHVTHGMALLSMLDDTLDRAQNEFRLQLSLGASMVATKGHSAPEVEQAYSRARELCQQMGETPQLFQALVGLSLYYAVRAEHLIAHDLAERLLSMAQRRQDSVSRLQGHTLMGLNLWYLGDLSSARTHLEQGMALYDTQQHHALAISYGEDFGVVCLSRMPWVLWTSGYPDQALRKSNELLDLARSLAHPFSLCRALNAVAMHARLCRDRRMALMYAEECVAVASEQGFPVWLIAAENLRNWALDDQDDVGKRVVQIRRYFDDYRDIGAALWQPWFLGELAEIYGQDGQIAQGLKVADEALTIIEQTEERIWEAELYRLKGELLLNAEGAMRYAELTPEDYFHKALAIAQSQRAKSWELRAATSLARLWQSQGKSQEAYELLEPVYGWFTEGFDTTDLKDAKALLRELEG